MEIWKDIKGYESYYQVSDLGRVKRLEKKITVNRKKGVGIYNWENSDKRQYWVCSYYIDNKRIIRYFSIDKFGYEKAKNLATQELENNQQIKTKIVNEKILKQCIRNKKQTSYLIVSLCKNNKVKNFQVHRLVLESFINNIENKPCVNHKNGNMLDNRLYNLEWCTYHENSIHAVKTGLIKSKSIICSNGMIFKSSFEAGEWVNLNIYKNTNLVKRISQRIRTQCNGNGKHAYGFNWEYKN